MPCPQSWDGYFNSDIQEFQFFIIAIRIIQPGDLRRYNRERLEWTPTSDGLGPPALEVPLVSEMEGGIRCTLVSADWLDAQLPRGYASIFGNFSVGFHVRAILSASARTSSFQMSLRCIQATTTISHRDWLS